MTLRYDNQNNIQSTRPSFHNSRTSVPGSLRDGDCIPEQHMEWPAGTRVMAGWVHKSLAAPRRTPLTRRSTDV